MLIKQLAKRPELIEIVLDDEEIIKNYGDSVKFYMKDFVDLTTYFDFFTSQSEKDGAKLTALMRRFILNEEGAEILAEGEELPIDIMVGALSQINNHLGKSKAKLSTPESGQQ